MENQEQNINNENLTNPHVKEEVLHNFENQNAKSKWLKIGIGVMIMVFIIGGVYLIGKNSPFKTPKTKITEFTPTTTTNHSISPTPKTIIKASTLDWVKYKNTELGFEIQFPNGFTAKGPIYNYDKKVYVADGTELEGPVRFINEINNESFTIDFFPFYGTANELLNYQKIGSNGSPLFWVEGNGYVSYNQKITINGIEAIYVYNAYEGKTENKEKIEPEIGAIFVKDNYGFKIWRDKNLPVKEDIINAAIFSFNTDAEKLNVCPQDLKKCPDGKTYARRKGSSCAFTACPGTGTCGGSDSVDCPSGWTCQLRGYPKSFGTCQKF